jgi:hypothetical protein
MRLVRILNMSNPFWIACLCILLLAIAGSAYGQVPRLKTPAVASAPPAAPPPVPPPAVALRCNPAAPSNLIATYIGSSQIDLAWTAPATPSGCTLDHYEIQRCKNTNNPDNDCNPTAIKTTPEKITTTSYNDTGLEAHNYYKYFVVAIYTDSTRASSPALYQGTVQFTCLLIPTRGWCMNFGNGKDANINTFYQTTGSYTFFGQIKSIYNGASGSATISADLGTLNFRNGMQVTLTTNAQAGSSGATPVTSSATPTLSSNGAGQATQNMLFGGNFLVSELYPLLAVGASKLGTAGGLGLSADFIAREGVDVQNFKSGTNFNVISPPFHGSGQIEGFLQYNSINLIPNSQNFTGSLFVGGSYGYSYTSPAYLRDYGFAGNQNNGIGLIIFGIVLNTVARISVSRGFGPSQTYIDSTTMIKTNVNNFKAWSIGVTYQSPTPASKQ